MPSCSGCGAHVSSRYHRVTADEDGSCLCPSCADNNGAQDSLNGIPGTF